MSAADHTDYETVQDLDDLRRQQAAKIRWETRYNRHPDCRDPDHPGCANCDEDFPYIHNKV